MAQKWREIPITAEQIALASKADSGHCMIADGIREKMPSACYVSVDLATIRFSDRSKGQRFVYLTPNFAQQQLLRFDQGVVVEPWTLVLPPKPAQVVPIRAHTRKPNYRSRPTKTGPKEVQLYNHDRQVTVVGGEPPPLGALAHSSATRGKQSGRRRIFGIKAAGTFDPSR